MSPHSLVLAQNCFSMGPVPPETLEVRLFSKPGCVLSLDGRVLAVPESWSLLPPGDAALSRRLKQAGPTWTVIEVKGRKRFSHGIWAPAETIEALKAERQVEKQDPAYQRQLESGRRRRAAEQVAYVEDFHQALLDYLAFAPAYATESVRLARLITEHATPVGSGTVARTERIPIDQRAEAATIAWMRHQTTGYDNMVIPLIKGRRREVRRMLAQRSVQLLERYRKGLPVDPRTCPLQLALGPSQSAPASHPTASQQDAFAL